MNAAPELPPYRPPSEAASALIRITRGCAWNRCAFCGMYKSLRFELRSFEDIQSDLLLRQRIQPVARSVFLGDSDSLAHPRLVDILPLVRDAFPHATRITSYSRLRTLERLRPEKLGALREAGLTRIHAGLESGSAEILARVNKGVTPEQAIAGGRKALAAGFELCLYVLCGLGGEEDWVTHATESAQVVAAISPRFVRLRSLALLAGTNLHAQWHAGLFHPATPLNRLRETRLFIERLAGAKTALEIHSDHLTNYVWADGNLIFRGINGKLPDDGESLLATLDEAIATVLAAHQVADVGSLALQGQQVFL